MPPLREDTFPSVTNTTPNSPPLPPFKAQVLNAWMAINVASARLQSHPHRSHLPSHYTSPSFFNPLLDGENMPSPKLPNPPHLITNNSSSNHPCRLIPPSLLNFQSIAPPIKCRLPSPPLLPPSPFWMCIKPRPTRARRDSSMAPLSMDRRHGMLECLSPSDSAISSREPTRSQLVLLIGSLALHTSSIKLSIVLFPTRPHSSAPWN